jgi:hypothetical protein
MKTLRVTFAIIAFLTAISCKDSSIEIKTSTAKDNEKGDPLPSWKDNDLKKSIISYVTAVSDSASADYIPSKDRIATFDNDGTLWCEKPLIQGLFLVYQMEKMLKAKPELAGKEPFKSFLAKGKEYFATASEKEILELFVLTHTGTTEDEFEASVNDFVATAKLPKRNVGLKQAIYQPQLELLQYLRAHGFKVFICTGGTVEFVRGLSQDFYDVPKNQVIGTTFKYEYDEANNTILRKAELNQLNDKGGKPVGIQQFIGQRPVLACGNEGGAGDIEMLKFCQGSKYKTFQLLVNHDDAEREAMYQEKDNASLNAAAQNKWHVISMKNDWKEIFVK